MMLYELNLTDSVATFSAIIIFQNALCFVTFLLRANIAHYY